MVDAPPRLTLQGICKRYPGVIANDDVSLSVRAGSIHAILGENGAGKSTLMKVIYGLVKPDAGRVLWDGRPVTIAGPKAARSLGIAMVFQHFSLFETLSAAENVWLGQERSGTLSSVVQRMRATSGEYGLEVDPERPVHALSVGERQRVEILRALLNEPRLLILDEPTSVLTPQAVEKLFVTLRRLAERGCSILYISHKLGEIRALCDRCSVLRAGRVSGEVDPRSESNESLARLMLGAEPPSLSRARTQAGEPALTVQRLSASRRDVHGVSLEEVSFELRQGEIVGVAGVSGNGQRELMALLSGEDTRLEPGQVSLFGGELCGQGPRARRALGLRFLPEERLGRAAVPSLSLAENTMLTREEPVARSGWLDLRRQTELARRLITAFKVKTSGPNAEAKSLSGGNLQRFLVGRELDAAPRVLLISQPTWGVDVGAASEIRAALLDLRARGAAILIVSEELDELFEVSDRLLVMAGGRLSPSIPIADATSALVGAYMAGLFDRGPAVVSSHAEEVYHVAP
ncbi:MAG: ABC transporter ATP-binding protein [Myxococcales bacterium]